jgi:hypothetical protein
MMQVKSINKTRKKNKRSKVKKYKSLYGKTLKSILKTNTMTRRNNKKCKTHRGGATPVGTPRTPRTPRTPIGPVTPLTLPGSNVSSNAIPSLASVAQQLQDYAYNRVSPYYSPGKRVVPVTELPGMGRDIGLSYDEKIHSTGDRISDEQLKQIIKSPLKRVSPKRKSRVGSPSFVRSRVAAAELPNVQTYGVPTAPPLSFTQPPTPPQAVLTSSGKLKTSYTPHILLIDTGVSKITTSTGVEIPYYFLLIPHDNPSEMSVVLPLSYIPIRSDPINTLPPDEVSKLDTINKYNEYYSYLSPNIYSILQNMNLTHVFGILLVWGKLCDIIIENIRISSVKTIQSRTLFSEEDAKIFLSNVRNIEFTTLFNMGPSPSAPNKGLVKELVEFKIPVPTHPPDPSSLQVVGYNTHPMFRAYLTEKDVDNLEYISQKNKSIRDTENVFVLGHGGMGQELSPQLKFLANKYIRLIELGKKHALLSASYASFFFHLSNILQDPANKVMFSDTDKGVTKRKELFDRLCKYLNINMVSSCGMKDTFKLTDITHDRVIEGHYYDSEIQEDHVINLKTLKSFYSMGIFKPVDYRQNKIKTPVYNKKIFQLYPGTTFFTKNTKIDLVKTLLPYAVKNNRVINVVLFSCAVEYTNMSPYYKFSHPSFDKPLETTPEMKILIEGKKFIFNLGRMTSSFLAVCSTEPFTWLRLKPGSDEIYQTTFSYFPTGKVPDYNIINKIGPLLKYFYDTYFIPFLSEISGFNYVAGFSFAGINGVNASFDLIQDGNPIADEPHANELRKVKIYLMDELYRMYHKVVNYYVVAFGELLNIYSYYISLFVTNTQDDIYSRSVITEYIQMSQDISSFFLNLSSVIFFIKYGKYGENTLTPPVSAAFLLHPKYVEAMKEYKKSNIKKIYDEINEGMDYHRYRVIDPTGTTLLPSPGKKIRGYIKNPQAPGDFYHTARSTYEYKERPNPDEAKERLLENKQQMFDQQNIHSLARKVRGKGDYNISV